MLISVFSALQPEIDQLVDSIERPRTGSISRWPVWSGRVGGIDVILARAGLGKVNTAALAAIIWDRYHPSSMLFSGVAGGLDPDLGVGDVVIGERTIQHDAGVIVPGGDLERYQAGHIPFYNPTDRLGYEPSPELLDAMRSVASAVKLGPVLGRDAEVRFGTILTGDQFLQDEETRDRLFTETSAQAIEMEGAALGQAADGLGVDHLVIRSLSDMAQGEAVKHFDRFMPEVSTNSARLVLGLLRRLEEDNGDLTVGA